LQREFKVPLANPWLIVIDPGTGEIGDQSGFEYDEGIKALLQGANL
jgi:hypothetical protein